MNVVRALAVALALAGCAPKAAPPASVSGASARASTDARASDGAGALTGELVVEGPLARRVSRSPADLVVFYGSEHKGSLETCGCPKRPRGSFARLESYVDASRAANPDTPSVLVNAGYWLQDAMGFDGKLRDDVAIANGWMVKGVRALGWDALNVSTADIAGLATLPPDGGPPLPLVSANVEGPGVSRWVIVQRGGLRVGITGITAPAQTLTEITGWKVGAPESAGPVLDALAEQADVVVLLAYQASEAAKKLAESHPAVDVVVDAGMHHDFLDPYLVDRAAWVLSSYQTMRLGELRLALRDGRVTGGLSRQIDLDPEVPDAPAMAALTKQARTELDAAQRAMYGP